MSLFHTHLCPECRMMYKCSKSNHYGIKELICDSCDESILPTE